MTDKAVAREDIVQTRCVLGVRIRTTQKYWQHIIDHKHGELTGQLDEVLKTLSQANEVYQHPTNRDLFFTTD